MNYCHLLSDAQIIGQKGHTVIKALRGTDAKPYEKRIAALRIDTFKAFPYLYEGSFVYEQEYLATYFNAPSSVILLILDQDHIVGFATAIVLNDEMDEIKEPFLQRNLDLHKHLYIGEVILQPAYRGQWLLTLIFDYYNQYALQIGCTDTVFMTVNRPPHHPMMPKDYRPPDLLWRYYGYDMIEAMVIHMAWRQIDTHKEECNQLSVWSKKVQSYKMSA